MSSIAYQPETWPAPVREPSLVMEKARRLSNGELANEIARCRSGLASAQSRSAQARFELRLNIMNAEADARMAAGGAR